MGNEASVPAGTSSADTTCGTRVRPTTPAPQWLESTATSAEASWTEINDAGGTDKPPARETSGAVDGDGNLFLIGGRDAKDEYADVHVRGAAGGWFKPDKYDFMIMSCRFTRGLTASSPTRRFAARTLAS